MLVLRSGSNPIRVKDVLGFLEKSPEPGFLTETLDMEVML
jgi:hypothetical protein